MAAASSYDLSNIARHRGDLWGQSLHYIVARPLRPWPAWDDEGPTAENVRRICRKKVGDLSRDPEQLEQLARVCSEAAAVGYYRGRMRVGGGIPATYEHPGIYTPPRRSRRR